MSLICSICKNEVPEGFGQCVACKAGFAPQLACRSCGKLVPRGSSTCVACERVATERAATERFAGEQAVIDRPVAMVPTKPSGFDSMQRPLPPMPPPPPMAISIASPRSAPPALPGLPAHVGLQVVAEQYSAGKFGVTASVQVPALDVEIMNQMGQVVVVAHTIASRISASLMEVSRTVPTRSTETALMVSPGQTQQGPTVEVIVSEMAQFVVILHNTAERMNHFQGFTESTRQLIREIRLLATDLQGEIETYRMTSAWLPSASLRGVIRQCRVLATELQNEIETRRGPQG